MPENRISVLILGGTGAMGMGLTDILAGRGCEVVVTSRSPRGSVSKNVRYLRGDAKDAVFLGGILDRRWDAIVDFMAYGTEEFRSRAGLLLSAASQYIFISSARVYAPSKERLTESSPRLLDVCRDETYLNTDEYALSKARQENLLYRSGERNFTIVRPSLTYNSSRLQFALGEKEEWLYRALHGRSIVFPADMADVRATMTWGTDVALAISRLIGNEKAYGETVHITAPEAMTWEGILGVYRQTLRKKTGLEAKVFLVEDALKIAEDLGRLYQVKYARAVSREFDGSRLEALIGKLDFTPMAVGLDRCLTEFLDGEKRFLPIPAKPHAYFDRLTGERSRSGEFSGWKGRLKYEACRYMPMGLLDKIS